MADKRTYQSVMLTTVDNPYDPFYQFTDWYRFDNDPSRQYDTCGYLARVFKSMFPDYDYNEASEMDSESPAVEMAIDAIIANDFQNLYKKVAKEVEEGSFDSKTI